MLGQYGISDMQTTDKYAYLDEKEIKDESSHRN